VLRQVTMTTDYIDNGRLICEFGVAVVRPVEYLIFRISQKTMDAFGLALLCQISEEKTESHSLRQANAGVEKPALRDAVCDPRWAGPPTRTPARWGASVPNPARQSRFGWVLPGPDHARSRLPSRTASRLLEPI
jgi:hypothetical protein